MNFTEISQNEEKLWQWVV